MTLMYVVVWGGEQLLQPWEPSSDAETQYLLHSELAITASCTDWRGRPRKAERPEGSYSQ